jgi:hypothetical protein
MAWDLRFHPDLAVEFLRFSSAVQVELLAHTDLLTRFGPSLGRPAVDTLKGSRIANLKELRFTAEGGIWRVAFAFDGKRIAVLLAAGDKRGKAQQRFYKTLIALAEQRWESWS